jgi:predicted O-methyltransferase YrrM
LFGDVCSIVKPCSILEIGSWMGGSAIAWAKTSSEFQPNSAVYCVDTWLGSVEHFLSTCGDSWNIKKLSLSDYGPTFFDDFIRNIWDSGYQEKILPFRASSSSALPFFAREGLRFDVVYVDGAHDVYSVFQDITGALKIISKEGLICGDDFGWDSVRGGLALSALAHRKPLAIYVKEDDFVILNTSSSHHRQSLSQRSYARWKTKDMIKSLLSLFKQFMLERFK